IPDQYHAIVAIRLDADAPQPYGHDLTLEVGRVVAGSVVDADGKPLTGAYATGLSAVPAFGRSRPLPGADFQVGGLAGQPRRVLLFHSTTRVGRLLTVRPDEPGPLQVRLDQPSAVRGRLLAGDRPQVGTKVRAVLTKDFSQLRNDLPYEVWVDRASWSQRL